MNYAIEVLQKERDLINQALKELSKAWKKYPEEEKRQKKKVRQLNQAIERLENQ